MSLFFAYIDYNDVIVTVSTNITTSAFVIFLKDIVMRSSRFKF